MTMPPSGQRGEAAPAPWAALQSLVVTQSWQAWLVSFISKLILFGSFTQTRRRVMAQPQRVRQHMFLVPLAH